MQLSVKEAERVLHKAAVKESSWLKGVGCRFRLYKVPGNFDCDGLPADFELIYQLGRQGDKVIREWRDCDPLER